MEQLQSFDEAVLKLVKWWSSKMQQPLNQNNGDNTSRGAMAFALSNMLSSKTQKSITPEKIKIFEEELTKKLKSVEDQKHLHILDVDYNPDRFL